ncbi:hypothetical protein RN001_000788 [Aquatica leii]|uniref:Uncharacterized protein n=1 Tax=Aquatica leii TaxID=1421715 RepID=A0AAN7PFD4_9COLE|nr:hypothetical protein RN001_000788 [Aquatica leii]
MPRIVTVYLIYLKFVDGFNFDTDFPIVYTNPKSSTNDRASFFGYSVILHELPPWIQIGEPRGNSTRLKEFEPGVVHKCSIHGPCFTIDVDRNVGFYSIYQDSFLDRKEKAWIGGAMDIDSVADRIVVCGHRWVNDRVQDYWMLGACYWAHANETTFARLIPLLDNEKGIIRDKAAKVNVYYFGQGQTGMSAHFSKSKNQSELILGAPGVYNWDGTTLIYKDGPDNVPLPSKLTSGPTGVSKRDTGFIDFANLNIADAIKTTQIGAFNLFGYASTSGYFFKKDQILYVSGAPRSRNLVGQILVYEFADYSEQPLNVKDSRQGYQYGEYFGAALSAGDINEDGYDDLIVGAPFYTSGKYNEGRVFLFMGSAKGSFETPLQNGFIEGKAMGGQFGSCLMFLGDIHQDGYADVAIGAPYENENSGVVYIYRGSAYGLTSEPSQRIVGKDFDPNIKGFGISISKPTDIDMNRYTDLAIGAYLSGHTVLLRSKPVVTLQQSVILLTPRLEHNAKSFDIKACFWYTGFYLPPSILVRRKVVVDELLLRAFLSNTTSGVDVLLLNYNNIMCENITLLITNDLTNRYDPITVTVSQELIMNKTERQIFYVGKRSTNQLDKFCKSCPILNPIRSLREQKLELTFVLGCGDDNICRTKLDLQAQFLNISDNNRYVLGSMDYLKLEVTITNNGDKAYLTQLLIDLPKSVYFRSIPISCLEQNSSSSILCGIDNPLYETRSKRIILDLDMKEINSFNSGDQLKFQLTVLTSSENSNNNVFIETLNIVREADVYLTGKSGEQSYAYGNTTQGIANFTQTYQVEKFGASTIDEISLDIKIPTQMIYKNEIIKLVHLYTPEGYHAHQPINCYSTIDYLVEDSLNDIESVFDLENIKELPIKTTPETYDLKNDDVSKKDLNQYLSRGTREVKSDFKDDIFQENSFPYNRTMYINCSNDDIICETVSCLIGPFKLKQNSAILQLRMMLNVSSILGILGKRDIIVFATEGLVTVRDPKNFIQTGLRPDSSNVLSVFIAEPVKSTIETWIIILAAIAGLLLLLLLVIGLIKAGFFQRKKKMELKALKEAEKVEQHFKQEGDREALNTENVNEDELDNDEADFDFEILPNVKK